MKKVLTSLFFVSIVAASHQFLQFDEAAKIALPAASFASDKPEGVFPTQDAVPENVGIRTFTSKAEEGGRGNRFSDHVDVMPIFASKAKSI